MSLFVPSPFMSLPEGQARVILCDPPWHFANYSAKGEQKNPVAHYGCMALDDIKALPVRELADPSGCALVMWATAPMLPQAVDTMRSWGFDYVSAGAWAKQSKTGTKWAFGTGYAYRSAVEFWLLGSVGSPKYLSRGVRNLIVSPVREHSRKPEVMRAMCERQFGAPRIELFARESAPGWLSWGNQVSKFDDLEDDADEGVAASDRRLAQEIREIAEAML